MVKLSNTGGIYTVLSVLTGQVHCTSIYNVVDGEGKKANAIESDNVVTRGLHEMKNRPSIE